MKAPLLIAYAIALVCTLAGLIAVSRINLVVVTIQGQSMYPTLKDGDRVLAWCRWPQRWLRRGQIVLMSPWLSYSSTLSAFHILHEVTPYIKRIVGLGGDKLVTSIADLSEDLRPDQLTLHDDAGLRTWHVPPKHIFVRSDNIHGGFDSLTWGPVPCHTVLAVVIVRLANKSEV